MNTAVPSKALTSCVTANTAVKPGKGSLEQNNMKNVLLETHETSPGTLHKPAGDRGSTETNGALNTNNLGTKGHGDLIP